MFIKSHSSGADKPFLILRYKRIEPIWPRVCQTYIS